MSAATDFLMQAGQPEIERDRWGRPMVIPPGGGQRVHYERCTTYIDVLDNKRNLENWKMRSVGIGLAMRSDLYDLACSLGPEDGVQEQLLKEWRDRWYTLTQDCLTAAKSNAKANTGTALHRFTEKLDRGQPLGPVPPRWVEPLKSYERATAGLTARHIEQSMVLDEYRIHGTPDRVVEVDGESGLFIADVKSGSVEYPHKMACQLAVYAHGVLYDDVTGARTDYGDVVNLDRGIIMELSQQTGECRLHWIDLRRGWEGALLAVQVHRWRQEKALTRPMGPARQPALPVAQGSMAEAEAAVVESLKRRSTAPVEPNPAAFPLRAAEVAAALAVADKTDPAVLASVRAAIANAASADDLVTLWKAAGPAWTEEFTTLSKQRKAELAR